MNDISLSIGEKILIFRRREGFSRKQLADIIGVSVSTIANYENGVTMPDSHTLSAIAAILNIKMDMLLFDRDAENNRSRMHRPKLTQSQMKNMF